MSSYWSSLVETTTSRVASLRQNLLPGENDGETDDDTHLCRVLRSYYTEKGRSFPAWLPPDPRAPPPAVVQPAYAQSNIGSRYGAISTDANAAKNPLSRLFDTPPPPQLAQQDPPSLRQGRGQARLGQGAGVGSEGQNPFSRTRSVTGAPPVQSRPLPSKMAGSYQTAGAGLRSDTFTPPPPGSSTAPPMSAKDRLRAGNLRRPEARSTNSADAVSFSSQGGRVNEKPFVAATSPWASSEAEFGGGGYESSRRPQGVQSGPGAGRRVGLPSGPRGPR